MSNFIYYEKLEDYEEQVRKAKLCDEKDKEIERLKDDNKYLNKVNIELSSEKNRLNNIIKEVREYIKDKYAIILADDLFLDHDERIERKRLLEILEILDKEK